MVLVASPAGFVVVDGRLYEIDTHWHTEDVTEEITGDLAEVLG